VIFHFAKLLKTCDFSTSETLEINQTTLDASRWILIKYVHLEKEA